MTSNKDANKKPKNILAEIADVEVQRHRPRLRPGVHRKMRFGKHHRARRTSRSPQAAELVEYLPDGRYTADGHD